MIGKINDNSNKIIALVYFQATLTFELFGIIFCFFEKSSEDISSNFGVLLDICICLDSLKIVFALVGEILVYFVPLKKLQAVKYIKYIYLGYASFFALVAILMPIWIILSFEDSDFGFYPQLKLHYIIGSILYSLIKYNIVLFSYFNYVKYVDSSQINEIACKESLPLKSETKDGEENEEMDKEKEKKSKSESQKIPIYLLYYYEMKKQGKIN